MSYRGDDEVVERNSYTKIVLFLFNEYLFTKYIVQNYVIFLKREYEGLQKGVESFLFYPCESATLEVVIPGVSDGLESFSSEVQL